VSGSDHRVFHIIRVDSIRVSKEQLARCSDRGWYGNGKEGKRQERGVGSIAFFGDLIEHLRGGESMTKADLVSKIAGDGGITKAQAEKAVDGFVAAVTDSLATGDKVTLVGFGTFSVGARTEREGRNPRTGEKITIPASKVVKFKPGKSLSDKVK
jgi:DNA-binding protein HU-beta